ncbi:hypothetical protein BXZ70DRAFT_508320 [Cristinia sonorae]|uniref:DUF6535 domain-containing protein n=1 Tax=Cristinia sonorae TaxID=1940300 RepID=A0A8K0UWC5_9AGAR|nr:hypothetical protein BXZ70DRAFT_508320 [Cristinia sonorae]
MPSSIASKGGESVASEPPDLERGDKAISKDVKPPVNETEDQSSTGYAVNKIWTIYNHKSESHDSALVSRLNSSMDSILVFAGLFSAVVTAFIIESYKMLNPDSGDITVFYLTQLTREVMKLSTTTDIPPPPTAIETPHAVAVNVLWVLSLIASLACALGATLIQTWTSRYLRVVSRSPDAVSRARARAWYFDGLKKSQMEAFAAGVPMILHLALWLFLAGLVVFLFPVNRKVANAALGAAAACGVIYLTFAFMDLFVGNSPYKTPFSVCLSVIILGFAGSIFFGFALGVAALLLGLILITLVLALPALPITYFAVGPKKVASEWKDLWSSESPAGLPDAEKWDNYRKGGSSHVYNRLVDEYSGGAGGLCGGYRVVH